MITINDVAKHCNVAKSTVSNALTGKKYVSPELKQKIMDACKELDFQPNFYASSLSHGNSKILALVLEQDSTSNYRGFYTPLIVACLKTAARSGRHLLVYSGLDAQEAKSMLKRDRAPIDGAILMTPLVDDSRIRQMEEQMIPCVVIGHPASGDMSYVDIDNVKMLSDVVKRLYGRGWRKFRLVNSERNKTISVDRAEGFGRAISELEGAEGTVCYPDELVERPPECGAAYIASDGKIAASIYRAAKESGTEPGKDFALYSLGEDDENEVHWEYARQDYSKLGERAMEMLVAACEGDTEPKHVFADYYTL